MNIWLVEDDHFQAKLIEEKILERFPAAEIRRIKTESNFRALMDQLPIELPDVVVMDVMLRWADAAADMPDASSEIQREGFYRAGLRCQKLLAGRKETERVPVILYTVLESIDLKPELEKIPKENRVTYLRKHSDLMPLLDKIYREELRQES
jgi:CheY-like chemotaxis protein